MAVEIELIRLMKLLRLLRIHLFRIAILPTVVVPFSSVTKAR